MPRIKRPLIPRKAAWSVVAVFTEALAHQHYHWQRQIDGLRLLLGVRLVDWALEQPAGPEELMGT